MLCAGLMAALVSATPTAKPYCNSTYADDFSVLSKNAIELANKPDANFTYCVRTTATYECLSYGSDGSVKRAKRQALAHGTGFAYRKHNGETLMLTNAHVAEWPAVTDDDHPVAGVPMGCKRVSDQLRIVDNEKDTYEGDDIPLVKVVTDPALDMAVVKSKVSLNVMPWRVGRSSALRERNVVEVRGFPLGAFKATVQGRVTSAFDHDDYKEWDHDDFVVDAQLSGGNSGSPVMAVNCQSGEYELVGVFHADYSRGNSLNVVVHIDQVRELMTTLKRSTPLQSDSAPLTGPLRRRLIEASAETGHLFVPFGALVVEATPRADGAFVYSVYPHDFPLHGWPLMIIEDLDRSLEGGFGQLGRLWAGNARGLKELSLGGLDAEDRIQLDHSLDALRRLALLVAAHRKTTARSTSSREAADDLARLEREIRRLSSNAKEIAQALNDFADRYGPSGIDEPVSALRPFSISQPDAPVSGPK
jgi:serine protease Do